MARFNGNLTPEQRVKYEQIRNKMVDVLSSQDSDSLKDAVATEARCSEPVSQEIKNCNRVIEDSVKSVESIIDLVDDEEENISAEQIQELYDMIEKSIKATDEKNKENDKKYFKDCTDYERQPITKDSTRVYMTNEPDMKPQYSSVPKTMVDELDKKKMFRKPHNKKTVEHEKKAASKTEDFSSLYKDHVIKVCGKPLKFKSAVLSVDWSKEFGKNKEKNANKFSKLFTKMLIDSVGISRITNISVVEDYIIINGINSIPKLSNEVFNKLPQDMIDDIKNGYLAKYFNWGTLKKMHKLSCLSVTSMESYLCYICSDLCIEEKEIFDAVPSLKIVEIAGSVLTKENKDTSASVEVIEKASVVKRKHSILSKFKGLMSTDSEESGIIHGFNEIAKAGWEKNWKSIVNHVKQPKSETLLGFGLGLVARIGLMPVQVPSTSPCR